MSSRLVSCPQCGKDALFSPENPSRPFCSERCRLIDLGEWASEGYRIVVQSQDSLGQLMEELADEDRSKNSETDSRRDSEDSTENN